MGRWTKWDTGKFVLACQEIHGEKFDYSDCIYMNSKTKVKIKCNACGNEWEVLPQNHLQGRGCKKCQYGRLHQNQALTHDQWVAKAVQVHGERFEYLTQYVSNKKPVKIRCLECGAVNLQRASSHLSGCGCKKCQYKNLPQNQYPDADEFERMCKKIHGDKYEYCGDFRGSRRKIKILCKIHCEYFYQNASAHLHKQQGCPKCNLSRGELKIEQFLKEHGIPYDSQKRFFDCRYKLPLPFDFYLPLHNVCIEYDGEHHYFPVKCFGGNPRWEIVKLKDEIRGHFCEANGIRLIRIPYFEFNQIEEKLAKELLC